MHSYMLLIANMLSLMCRPTINAHIVSLKIPVSWNLKFLLTLPPLKLLTKLKVHLCIFSSTKSLCQTCLKKMTKGL